MTDWEGARAPGQWALGNQNVQIHTVAAGATVSVSFGAPPRRVPLQRAIVPVGPKVSSPARLMRARSGVLPFVDSAGLMTRLEAWMTGSEPFATYLVGGRGGSGKTRLGVELCRIAESQAWLCGLLEGAAEQAAVEALAAVPTARLVVVDYAESRAEQLEVLLPILAEQATIEHPVRVLLLVRASPRHDDWSELLRGRSDWLDAVLDDTEQLVLDDQSLTVAQRQELFTATATAFTERKNSGSVSETISVLEPPPQLEKLLFATPLQVVILAYLAVHEPKKEREGNLPTTREGLLDQLVVHEDRYWQSTATPVGIDKTLRARIVAIATLAGADSEAEASRILTLVPDLADATAERRGRLARWAHDLYPGPRWWNPLEPDLLGEHLVAAHFTEYPGVLAGVLQRDDPTALTQPLELYARAAADNPAFAAALGPVLTTALPDLCRAAVAQVTTHTDLELLLGTTTVAAALNRAVTTIPVDIAALYAALNIIPARRDLILGPLVLTLTDRLTTAYRRLAAADRTAYEPDLAGMLNDLAVRLAEVGRRGESLTISEEAVAIYERLADTEPAAYEPNLAAALQNLSIGLAEVGRPAEALTAIQEAVAIYDRLADTEPAAYEPDLTGALNNLSIGLAEVGRPAEALAVIEVAVAVWRRLAAEEPAAYEPDLATALRNLSIGLAEVGRPAEALTAIQDAVAICERLATAEPAAYEPDLAAALNSLSILRGATGQRREALAVMEEAVAIYERLAAAEPAAYEPYLAATLQNLSSRLAEVGRPAEALTANQDAVAIYDRLAAAEPATYEPDLAGALLNLSNRLTEVGRPAEALAVIEETVVMYERLAAAEESAAYEPSLAGALLNLSSRLAEVGRPAEALTAIQDAVAMYERLATMEPAGYEPDLAGVLENLSSRLAEVGRPAEALTAIQDAVAIYGRLAAEEPAAYEPDLAAALQNLSTRLAEVGRYGEAEVARNDAEELGSEQ